MTTEDRPPVFLERASYRQRRLLDAIRVLPVLGAVLWLVPVAWTATADGAPATSAARLFYIFAVWFLLILLAALLASLLGRSGSGAAGPD